jgi:hypothetical protein
LFDQELLLRVATLGNSGQSVFKTWLNNCKVFRLFEKLVIEKIEKPAHNNELS